MHRRFVNTIELDAWAPTTTGDAESTWEPVLDAMEWRVAFLHPVSPEFIETAYGKGRWKDGASPPVRERPSGLPHELHLLRSSEWMSPWRAGALDGYARLLDRHLDKALRKTGAVPAGEPRPTHRLAKVLVLMRWAAPAWGNDDCAAVLRKLIGLSGPRRRQSLLLQPEVLGKIEGGCLARDACMDAQKFQKAEGEMVVRIQVTSLNWLRQMDLSQRRNTKTLWID